MRGLLATLLHYAPLLRAVMRFPVTYGRQSPRLGVAARRCPAPSGNKCRGGAPWVGPSPWVLSGDFSVWSRSNIVDGDIYDLKPNEADGAAATGGCTQARPSAAAGRELRVPAPNPRHSREPAASSAFPHSSGASVRPQQCRSARTQGSKTTALLPQGLPSPWRGLPRWAAAGAWEQRGRRCGSSLHWHLCPWPPAPAAPASASVKQMP